MCGLGQLNDLQGVSQDLDFNLYCDKFSRGLRIQRDYRALRHRAGQGRAKGGLRAAAAVEES